MKRIFGICWRSVYPPLIYLGSQVCVSSVAAMVFAVAYGYRVGASGGELDPAAYMADTAAFLIDNTLLLTLISVAVSLPVLLFVFWRKERKTLPEKTEKFGVGSVFLIIILSVSLNIFLTGIINVTGIYQYFPQNEEVVTALTTGSVVLQVIVTAILIPVTEEICFRALVFNRLKKWTTVTTSVIVSSLIFAVAHFNVLQGIYTFLVGLAIVLVYQRFQTIWASITAHVAFNGFTVAATKLEEFELNDAVTLAIIGISAVIVAGMFLVLFRKKTAKQITDNN